MKALFKDARPGIWFALAAACVGVAGSIAYLIVYMATAGQEIDRVFSWLTFGLILGGAVVLAAGEVLKLSFTPILGGALISVGFANHVSETAYPLADVLTGVPFFGGNATLAIVFCVVFAMAAVLNIASAFMQHRAQTPLRSNGSGRKN